MSTDAPPAVKSKKKLILMVAGIAVVGVVAYALVLPKLKPATAAAATGATHSAAASPSPSPKPGPVLKEEPITLNLAGDHYLRLGLALQLPASVAESQVDGSKALDLAITMLSGKSVAALSGSRRAQTIADFNKAVIAAYGPSTVSAVYLTDFVMQ